MGAWCLAPGLANVRLYSRTARILPAPPPRPVGNDCATCARAVDPRGIQEAHPERRSTIRRFYEKLLLGRPGSSPAPPNSRRRTPLAPCSDWIWLAKLSK